jgi:predicted pyridoxine 5'-phosphate oxidase superfamily flavin-nucleotide-binding protein
MTKQTKDIQAAKNAFNTIKVLKGQAVSIATCDDRGVPNVAPIGSMRIVDDQTVHVLQGFLHKTISNLKKNPKATFSVCLRPSILDSVSMFKEEGDEVLGYQVYCDYVSADGDKTAIIDEFHAIKKRVPFFFRGMFLKFCEKNLSRLLKFRIVSVRAITSPS